MIALVLTESGIEWIRLRNYDVFFGTRQTAQRAIHGNH